MHFANEREFLAFSPRGSTDVGEGAADLTRLYNDLGSKILTLLYLVNRSAISGLTHQSCFIVSTTA
jgi:hypothetical protein